MKIKNRLIAGVLCLLMVLSCVSGLTSCNDDHDHDTCSHQWGEWSTTKAATCTEAGANVIVAGSAVFGAEDINKAVCDFKK